MEELKVTAKEVVEGHVACVKEFKEVFGERRCECGVMKDSDKEFCVFCVALKEKGA